MGTNYYAYADVCEHCGRGDIRNHIGKNSGGWTFSWHGGVWIMGEGLAMACTDWYEYLARPGVVIKHEYGDVVSLEKFRKMVESSADAARNHAREYPNGSWLDEHGCSFSGYEFS